MYIAESCAFELFSIV